MKRFFLSFSILLLFCLLIPVSTLKGVNTNNTKMLTHPAVSQDSIAFVYANDLWTADLQGSNVRRLTSHKGIESYPVFSPDGKWIAFNGEYDGNRDVYLIPSQGGIPKRLTWHPSSDTVRAFTPEGNSVLFMSSRFSSTRGRSKLFKVSLNGNMPIQDTTEGALSQEFGLLH